MANPFVHVELATNDVAKAKAFYGKLFDWKMEDVPMESGAYTMIGVGEGIGEHTVGEPGVPRQQRAVEVRADHAACAAPLVAALAVVPEPGDDTTERRGQLSLSLVWS